MLNCELIKACKRVFMEMLSKLFMEGEHNYVEVTAHIRLVIDNNFSIKTVAQRWTKTQWHSARASTRAIKNHIKGREIHREKVVYDLDQAEENSGKKQTHICKRTYKHQRNKNVLIMAWFP